MKGSPVKLAIGFALLAATAVAMADSTLKLGSPAPALKIAKWVKGEPVAKFEPGKVYVVEFWATWCGPCKQSIPHLTELAKKYKGKVSFNGVSVLEERPAVDEKYFARVEKFVSDWGPKMDYNVAIDGKESWMWKNWGEASNAQGIPTAYVIDQRGSVAWIGHPMDPRFDQVIGEVVDGKFDLQAEVDRQAKEKEVQNKAMAEVNGFMDPFRKQDFKTALVELNKAFAKNPKLEDNYGLLKFQALGRTGSPETMAYAKKLAGGVYKDSSMALNSLAWSMVDDKSEIKNVDFKVAVEIAEKSVALVKPGQDMEAAYNLDTLAYAYYKDKQIAKAIATQERALAAAKRATDFDAATLKEIQDRLAMFKSKA